MEPYIENAHFHWRFVRLPNPQNFPPYALEFGTSIRVFAAAVLLAIELLAVKIH